MSRRLHSAGAWVSLVLLLPAGCQGFDQLMSGDPAVSEEEVHAAGQASDEGELTDSLHEILRRHQEYSTEVVVAAIEALGERGQASSVPFIADLAGHESEEVRWHVAVALKKIGGDDARVVLSRMAANDSSELVREEAAGM